MIGLIVVCALAWCITNFVVEAARAFIRAVNESREFPLGDGIETSTIEAGADKKGKAKFPQRKSTLAIRLRRGELSQDEKDSRHVHSMTG